MKDTEIRKTIQQAIEAARGRNVPQCDISDVCREYRNILLTELLEDMKTCIPGIGTIYAVKHARKKVFKKVIKAHYCLKLRPSRVLRFAINEIHHVDKSK